MGSYAGVMVGGTMRLWREMNRVYFGMVRKKEHVWNAEQLQYLFFWTWDQAAFCFWDDESDQT